MTQLKILPKNKTLLYQLTINDKIPPHKKESKPTVYDVVSLYMVAVKVVLVPEGHVMTVAFAIGLSIQELKCHLASELRVPADVLQISLDGMDGNLFSTNKRWEMLFLF